MCSSDLSNKIYVGSSINIKKRWRRHKNELQHGNHDCIHLQHSYNKHGIEVFVFQIVEAVEPVRGLILQAEQRWIDKTPNLFNTCKIAGSRMGIKHTDEQRKKISGALTGKTKTPEHREALRIASKKRIHDPELVAAFAKNRLGIKQTDEHKAKKNAALRISKANRTPDQKYQTRIKNAKTRGSLITINGVEYLS